MAAADDGARRRERHATRRPAVGCHAVSRPTRFAGVGMVTVLTMDVPDDAARARLGRRHVRRRPGLRLAHAHLHRHAALGRPAAAADAAPPRGTTLIHKLDTSDPSRTTYRGQRRGARLPAQPVLLSEHDGHLRVASTEEPDWWSPPDGGRAPVREPRDRARPSATAASRAAGWWTGSGSGERIHAVRFLGDRGYVVTFRQTDPLFALDLSDPAHPARARRAEDPRLLVLPAPDRRRPAHRHRPGGHRPGRARRGPRCRCSTSPTPRPRGASRSGRSTPTGRRPSRTTTPCSGGRRRACWWCRCRAGRPAGHAVPRRRGPGRGPRPPASPRSPACGTRRRRLWAPVRRSLVVGDALYTISDTGMLASDLDTLAPRGWAAFR